MESGPIYVGIGGWDYEPWRGTFFPDKLPKAKQLAFVGERLTATEVNATYYRLQKPETFAKWAKAVPEGFKFAVKASRYCTNRRVLADAGEAVEKFVAQGLAELGDKLGPVLWQFMTTKQFDADDMGAFLALLPAKHAGVRLQHALEPRHESFRDPAFTAMARKHGAAIVFADSDDHPTIDEATASFTYSRLQKALEATPTGYDAAALDEWAALTKAGAGDGRAAYVFMINGAKVRAPAAAEALIERL